METSSTNIETELKKSSFVIDALHGYVFPGFTKGEEWNGWACPYFTREQAEGIVNIHCKVLNANAGYDSNEDKFVFEFPDETEEYSTIIVDGEKLYPIGTHVWIWEEKE